jgi:hypothetical protein
MPLKALKQHAIAKWIVQKANRMAGRARSARPLSAKIRELAACS